MTLHKCNNNLTRKNGVLSALPLETNHTAEYLAKKIADFFESKKLSIFQMICMARDNAAVMIKLCELLGVDS